MLVARSAAPAEVFSMVASSVRELLGADAAAILRFEPDATATTLADVGFRTPLRRTRPLEPNLALATIFRTGRPARTDDLASAGHDATGETVRREGIRASVYSPIHVGGQVWGALAVLSRRGPFPVGAEQRITDFTELAATAIANTEAQAEVTASRARVVAAADQARRRIERDLHDGAQQRLVSLALQLREVQAAMPRELGAQLDGAVAEAAGALDELQEIARGIHPAILAEKGLGPALRALGRRSPVPVDLQVQVNKRLPEPVETSAYYVIAEALTNAAKHARASALSVHIEVTGDVLLLAVRDDGAGGAGFTGGTGLAGLKDRVEALGGRIFLDSPPGGGTSLRAELPLTAPALDRGRHH
jgi:signal transduction histidine kinase